MMGGSATNGNGGAFANMSDWARQPLLGYRILQDPGAYVDTMTLWFDLSLSGTTLDDRPQFNRFLHRLNRFQYSSAGSTDSTTGSTDSST